MISAAENHFFSDETKKEFIEKNLNETYQASAPLSAPEKPPGDGSAHQDRKTYSAKRPPMSYQLVRYDFLDSSARLHTTW